MDNKSSAREFLAHYGKEPDFPKIAGAFKGRSLVIVADAWNVWDDLEAFDCRVDGKRCGPPHKGKVYKHGWDFMTINKMVETFPGDIEHTYSNEIDHLQRYIDARRPEYRREFSGPAHIHSIRKAQWNWPWSGNGSSLLGGAFVGLMLGYEQIMICGGPLDDGPHNGEPHWRRTSFSREVTEQYADGDRANVHWVRFAKLAAGRVNSMSGRTKEWLCRSGAAPA